MNELTTHAGAVLLRVCVFGPFAYIGLLMMIDPLGFRGFIEGFAEAIRSLSQPMQGAQWQQPARERGIVMAEAAVRKFVRFAGAVVTAWAVVQLVGMGS